MWNMKLSLCFSPWPIYLFLLVSKGRCMQSSLFLYFSVERCSALLSQVHFIIWDFLFIIVFFQGQMSKRSLYAWFIQLFLMGSFRKTLRNSGNNIFEMKNLVFHWLIWCNILVFKNSLIFSHFLQPLDSQTLSYKNPCSFF